MPSGTPILRENPLAGVARRLKIRPNKTPLQPMVSHDAYLALQRGARGLPMHVRVFLAIAGGTGRRAGAIRALEWADVSADADEIYWRADADKMGHLIVRVTVDRVQQYLRVWRQHCPSDRYVFPAPNDPGCPGRKPTVDNWSAMLYRSAGLERPKGEVACVPAEVGLGAIALAPPRADAGGRVGLDRSDHALH